MKEAIDQAFAAFARQNGMDVIPNHSAADKKSNGIETFASTSLLDAQRGNVISL